MGLLHEIAAFEEIIPINEGIMGGIYKILDHRTYLKKEVQIKRSMETTRKINYFRWEVLALTGV